MKDYYQVLGVSRNASDDEIKRAYRRLARKYHPDVNRGDPTAEARFKEINEAYQVLSDKEQRAKYDRFGSEFHRYEQTGFGGVDFSSQTDFADLFETLFGNRRTGGSGFNVRLDGQDVEQPVELTLEEAYHGTQRTLQFANPNGTLRTITVKIPAGIDTGKRVRVPGEGAPGLNGGRRGDLYLVVTVTPHSRFERKAGDLYTTVPVSMYTLLLGGQVQLPLLSGKTLTLTIPPQTQNGRVFRITGQGMPLMHSPQYGDLYVTVSAVLPTNLSPEARRLVEELRRLTGE
ncbi:DnaJ C-terminal domain-containing protein [Chloroflexus aggregans]|uniref:Chaperone DnaJ domain protein n=1 Tax=Chloroflexus aggregans (strain MD-66 / DSM 9485) TaxID=326427 RepID=B8GCP7_CHLAD|nr:J domain-containing protein [Chloroflexus aggregans]ACL23097.1 chaperone DnaJ domain protein [Chloroflexus aggregans DSM 9485]